MPLVINAQQPLLQNHPQRTKPCSSLRHLHLLLMHIELRKPGTRNSAVRSRKIGMWCPNNCHHATRHNKKGYMCHGSRPALTVAPQGQPRQAGKEKKNNKNRDKGVLPASSLIECLPSGLCQWPSGATTGGDRYCQSRDSCRTAH